MSTEATKAEPKTANPGGLSDEAWSFFKAEARRLRAAIYGDVTNLSWAALATVWTRPDNLHWLRENQPVHCAPCPEGLHWKAWNGHADAPASL